MSAATTHAIERTSPRGSGLPFIGRCRLCGQEGLSFEDALKPCRTPRGLTQDDALVDAIEGDDDAMQETKP